MENEIQRKGEKSAPQSPINLDKIYALAKKATPGPWHVQESDPKYDDDDRCQGINGYDNDGNPCAVVVTDAGFYPPDAETGEYIATVNPETMLRIIDAFRTLELAMGEMYAAAPRVSEDKQVVAEYVVLKIENAFAKARKILRIDL